MNKLLSLMDEHNLTKEDIEKTLDGLVKKRTVQAWRLGNRNCPDLAIAYIKQVRGLK
jgi:hypothetical protein